MTLGEVVTIAIAAIAILVVPYKLAKAWLWPSIRRLLIMSRLMGGEPSDQGVAAPLPATATDDGQRIATPGNAVNDGLPGNALPEAAREIVRFQAKVEAAAAIVESGKIGQTEAIEIIFGCKRSGRPESPYNKARLALLARMGPPRTEYYDDLKERIAQEVTAEPTR